MPDTAYNNALGAITPSEKAKQQAIEKMQQALAQQSGSAEVAAEPVCYEPPDKKTITLARRQMLRRVVAGVAACLVLVVALATPVYLMTYGGAGAGGSAQLLAPEGEAEGAMMAPYAASMADAPAADAAENRAALAEQSTAEDGNTTLEVEPFESGAMGFEGYLLYDFTERGLDTALYAAAAEEGSLPVFENTLPMNQYYMYESGQGFTEAELTTRVDEAAAKLGKQVTGHETRYNSTVLESDPVDDLYAVEATLDGGRVSAYRNGDIQISFDTLAAVDTGTPPAATADAAAHKAYLQELMEIYAPLLAYMTQPTAEILLEYSFDGTPAWLYRVYDAGQGAGYAVASRSFGYAEFYISEQDQFFNIWLHEGSFVNEIGTYPIITEQQALEQLTGGVDMSSAPEPFPGEQYVRGVEIVYYTSPQRQIYMPYYKFYVELVGEGAYLPERSPEGLHTYGAWYVPAVQPEYLVWPEEGIDFNG